MQDEGAVFLPLTGYRTDTTINEYDYLHTRGEKAHYWSTKDLNDGKAKAFSIDENGLTLEARDRYQGLSVRLVKDVENEQGIEDIIVTEKDKTRKILMDGTLYIIRDGRIYNATGVQVR